MPSLSWESNFPKPTSEIIKENNAILWTKQIFKTKPNHEVAEDFKNKIKQFFGSFDER